MPLRTLSVLMCTAVALTVYGPSAHAGPIDADVDSAMDHDPSVPHPPPVPVFADNLKPLWLEAFAQPEVDLKRLIAATIIRAHQAGMPGLDQAIVPLTDALEAPDQHDIVRVAAAQALVALDSRRSAAVLRKHAAENLLIAQVVEPALAAWKDPAAREMWLKRLSEPDVRPQSLLLAIDGLGEAGDVRAADRLLELALEPGARPDVRLSAARALARMRDSGLEDSARALIDDLPASLVNRLVAASLLSRHHGESARSLLGRLAVDDEPAVAAIALRRLLDIDPQLVLPLAPDAIRSGDPHVRQLGAEALIARPTAERIAVLGELLDDVHPDVRRYVRRELIKLAGQEALAEPVVAAAVKQLQQESWRGQEQAMFILVAREHEPVIPRLLELLESPRPEVMVTAAWALRRLEARDVLPQMQDRAERVTGELAAPGAPDGEPRDAMDQQLGQLFEAFGQMGHRPAEPLMRRLVPKNFAYPEYARSRAIWALGYLHAGQPDLELAQQLSGRLNDTASIPPESTVVRHASAISLGRMKAESELPSLRNNAGNAAGQPVGYCCYWSIHQITGEPIPAVEPARLGFSWFLTPLD